jgi:serine/threonine protein kinase
MTSAYPESQGDSMVGNVLGERYRIDAALGSGAVGAVYLATDLQNRQQVALKQWRAERLTDQTRGRFVREASALQALDHPGIVKVLDHGVNDGVPFVVLEYLDGQTVEAMIGDGKPLAVELALEIVRQALTAVAYAHEQDVVHRDLKPENLFVRRTEDGSLQVKVLDYGLAKFMQPERDPTKGVALTMAGMIMGTPLYMPPEQAAGSQVDLPVDVYALGCVLFELLSGRPPYLANTNLELLSAHLRAPIPKLGDARPDLLVAPELQALLERALAKKQTERFAHAGAMLAALVALPQPVVGPKPKPSAAELAAQAARAAQLPAPRPTPAGTHAVERTAAAAPKAPQGPSTHAAAAQRSALLPTLALCVLLGLVFYALLR